MTRSKPAWRPPQRDGVGASRVAAGAHFATTLDFLCARFPAVADWPDRLARGDVLDAVGTPVDGRAPCVPGTTLWYWRNPPPEPRVPFELVVLHQDAHLVVVDKPHFLPVTPGGRHLHETVLVRLRRQLGIDGLAPMHRLDRETAGVLVFVVRPEHRHAYHCLLRDRQVHKVYEAVAPWRDDLVLPLLCRSRVEPQPGADFMQMRVVAGPANAETRVELIGRVDPVGDGPALAHYRLTPLTGRKHQLRVQMNMLGLPIVGDRIYPHLLPQPAPDELPDYDRPLQLLAREIAFTDPVDGSARRFQSRRRLQLDGDPARAADAPGDR